VAAHGLSETCILSEAANKKGHGGAHHDPIRNPLARSLYKGHGRIARGAYTAGHRVYMHNLP